jgi:hypothetical protein
VNQRDPQAREDRPTDPEPKSADESRQNPSPGDGSEPLIRPPQLRTDEAERAASRLELFFDLAYVLVVAELAASFAKDLSWHGAAVFAGLFTITWWSWVTTTLYANRFDTNDIVYRLAKLGNTGAVIAMAASAQEAIGAKAVAFAIGYLVTRLLLLALYARAYRHVTGARSTIGIYLTATAAAATLWAASLAAPDTIRYAMWAAGILVEGVAPLVATRRGGGVPLHLNHLPERFGLFVILVLGESVASIVIGVHDTDWARDVTDSPAAAPRQGRTPPAGAGRAADVHRRLPRQLSKPPSAEPTPTNPLLATVLPPQATPDSGQRERCSARRRVTGWPTGLTASFGKPQITWSTTRTRTACAMAS